MGKCGARYYRALLLSLALAAAGCAGMPFPWLPGIPWPDDPLTTTGDPTADPADAAESGGVSLGRDLPEIPQAVPLPDCIEGGEPETATHALMWDLLNDYRIANGVGPLIYSKKLEEAAGTYARDLWEGGFFAHVDLKGRNPGQRAIEAGFCHQYVGENLAAGQRTVEAAQAAWENSPSHDANMLEPRYRYAAVGYFVAPSGRIFWVQEFAYDLP